MNVAHATLGWVRLFATLWTLAHQASLCMAFSRQEAWSRFPCSSPRDLPDPGTEPASLMSVVSFFLLLPLHLFSIIYHSANS